MKTCFKCGVTKDLSLFHKHKGMKDGRLNKCAECVVKAVAEWRLENPTARKEEHARNREKRGIRTRAKYLEDISKNAKGRKIIITEYAHKRRLQKQQQKQTELDALVFQEAVRLTELRKQATNFNWNVDHIVPLNHKEACGLHNAFNLQVVPASWNFKKGNRNMNQFFDVAGY